MLLQTRARTLRGWVSRSVSAMAVLPYLPESTGSLRQ